MKTYFILIGKENQTDLPHMYQPCRDFEEVKERLQSIDKALRKAGWFGQPRLDGLFQKFPVSYWAMAYRKDKMPLYESSLLVMPIWVEGAKVDRRSFNKDTVINHIMLDEWDSL
jgi:hypothetical protein